MAFPVNYSVYHSGLTATPMEPTKFIPSAIAIITEFPFGKENIPPVNPNVQPPSTPPRSFSPHTPTTPTAAPSTPPRSPSPNQPAAAKTPSPKKRSSSPDTDSEPSSKRVKTPMSAKDNQRLVRQTEKLKTGNYPAVEKALSLLGKNTLAGHPKRELLGTGNFCETFATEDPNFVVKHLHRDGIMLRVFFTVASYWAKIQANYIQLEKLGVPVAKIENIATLDTDFFAVQQRVKPMKKLDPQHLVPGSQFAEQLKTAIAICYNNNLIIEIAKKNIGFIETSAGPQLQLIDIDDQTEEDGLDINLEQTLKSFGNELRAYLDPTPKN